MSDFKIQTYNIVVDPVLLIKRLRGQRVKKSECVSENVLWAKERRDVERLISSQ